MSIGKRLIDLARSELNSLLDRAADLDEDLRGDEWGGDLGRMSDAELEAELERRRRAREEAEEAATGRKAEPEKKDAGARRPEPPLRTPAGDAAVRRAYAALEVPPGSDFETVRRAYRRLMRKYHPDLHGGSPEAQRAANDLTQRLTESYKLLEKQLRK
ncbi:MAG TPA: J domain-containing protein [Polyangia bacterium]|nr:J domain-containing protein [Polyangia bacterium]